MPNYDSNFFAVLLCGFNDVRNQSVAAKWLHNLWQIGVHSGALACCKDNSMNIQRSDELSLIQVPYLFFLNF